MRNKAPILTGVREFKVIQSDMIHPDDRAKIMAALAEFKTPIQAKAGAQAKGFTVEIVDPRGRVVILKWKGADVALLFQRTINTVTITPVETAPAITVASADEAWIMVPLLGFRHDQQVTALQQRVQVTEQDAANVNGLLRQMTTESEQQRLLLDAQEKDLAEVTDERDRYKKACEGYEKSGKGILVKYKTKTKHIVKEVTRFKTSKKPLTIHEIMALVQPDKKMFSKLYDRMREARKLAEAVKKPPKKKPAPKKKAASKSKKKSTLKRRKKK